MSEYYRLSKEEKQKSSPAKQLRAKIMNTTVEASQDILKDSPDGVLWYQDELSGWFGSMDKYSGARGAASDRAFWLQAYNGGPYTVDRVSRGTVFIPNLSVSILGCIQPEPIRKLADGGVDDGLLQRFIPIVLRPAVGGRDEPSSRARVRLRRPGRATARPQAADSGGLLPADAVLTFDDGALTIREALEKKHLELQQSKHQPETDFAHRQVQRHLRPALRDLALRRARREERSRPVTEDTARRVASFLHGFLLPHALAFYAGVLGLANDHDRLADVAGYILAHRLERVTNRDVQRGDRTMRSLTAARDRSDLRAARGLRLGNENSGAASDRPAALGRQSGRASEVCRARKGGSRTPGA